MNIDQNVTKNRVERCKCWLILPPLMKSKQFIGKDPQRIHHSISSTKKQTSKWIEIMESVYSKVECFEQYEQ